MILLLQFVQRMRYFIFVLSFVSFVFAGLTSKPTYVVYKTNEPIKLDGKPDESIWKCVDTMKLTFEDDAYNKTRVSPSEYDKKRPIFAQAVWDSLNLYLYFWVYEMHIWSQNDTDDHFGYWYEQAVEIYIDGQGDVPVFEGQGQPSDYVEINLPPSGAVSDFLNRWKYTAGKYRNEYDLGIEVGLYFKGTFCNTFNKSEGCNKDIDTGFGMEVKIPFAPLKKFGPLNIDVLGPKLHAPPLNNEEWRVNLFYSATYPNITAPTNDDRLNYSWGDMPNGDFHLPAEYGYFRFADSIPPRIVAIASELKEKSKKTSFLSASLIEDGRLEGGVSIFDPSGKRIASHADHFGSVTGSNIRSGLYVVKANNGKYTGVRNVFIQKK